jgi:hypothetical protein
MDITFIIVNETHYFGQRCSRALLHLERRDLGTANETEIHGVLVETQLLSLNNFDPGAIGLPGSRLARTRSVSNRVPMILRLEKTVFAQRWQGCNLLGVRELRIFWLNQGGLKIVPRITRRVIFVSVFVLLLEFNRHRSEGIRILAGRGVTTLAI